MRIQIKEFSISEISGSPEFAIEVFTSIGSIYERYVPGVNFDIDVVVFYLPEWCSEDWKKDHCILDCQVHYT